MQQYNFTFCRLHFRIETCTPLSIGAGFACFRVDDTESDSIDQADLIKIRVIPWVEAKRPTSSPIGSDMLPSYYREGDTLICEAKGRDMPIASVSYDDSYSSFFYAVNEERFPLMITSVEKPMQLFPMLGLFKRHSVLLLHSAQISIGGRGIMFSAPSGTGKTTQAAHWCRLFSAELVCGDRTLLRKVNNSWTTFGYPVDGSTPMYDASENSASAIVVLKQAQQNSIERLGGASAISSLLGGCVFEYWDSGAYDELISLIGDLITDVPVYLFFCTKDESAAHLLNERLRKDGVIE